MTEFTNSLKDLEMNNIKDQLLVFLSKEDERLKNPNIILGALIATFHSTVMHYTDLTDPSEDDKCYEEMHKLIDLFQSSFTISTTQ